MGWLNLPDIINLCNIWIFLFFLIEVSFESILKLLIDPLLRSFLSGCLAFGINT